MTLYYSPSTCGFYDTTFATYVLPSDAEQITEEQRDQLIEQSMKTTPEPTA